MTKGKAFRTSGVMSVVVIDHSGTSIFGGSGWIIGFGQDQWKSWENWNIQVFKNRENLAKYAENGTH